MILWVPITKVVSESSHVIYRNQEESTNAVEMCFPNESLRMHIADISYLRSNTERFLNCSVIGITLLFTQYHVQNCNESQIPGKDLEAMCVNSLCHFIYYLQVLKKTQCSSWLLIDETGLEKYDHLHTAVVHLSVSCPSSLVRFPARHVQSSLLVFKSRRQLLLPSYSL